MPSDHTARRLRSLFVVVVPFALALAACGQTSQQAAGPGSNPSAQPAGTAPSNLQILFDRGSSNLNDAANQKLDQAARLYREGKPAVMFVAGHADKDGGEYPNLVLSGARARAAKEGLVARGIPADRLQLLAMGTSLPVDPRETLPADNRRVVITWR